jgi:hypothetical protein
MVLFSIDFRDYGLKIDNRRMKLEKVLKGKMIRIKINL